MSKRSQTEGLPDAEAAKSGAKGAAGSKAAKPLREYRSRAEREAEIQRYVILGTAVVVGVVAVLVVIALVLELVVTPNQAVASVNGETINVAQFQQRVRLERALINDRLNDLIEESAVFGPSAQQYIEFRLSQEPFQSWYNEIQVSDQLGNRVLNDMIEDRLVQEKAEELGITASPEDVQDVIRTFFEFISPLDPEAHAGPEATDQPEPTGTPTPFVSPTPSPVPTATLTPEFTATPTSTPVASPLPPSPTPNPTEVVEQFDTRVQDAFARVRAAAGVSQADVDAYFEMLALRNAVAKAVLTDMRTTQPEVDVRHILVATEAEANDVIEALNAGESFADLARAVSTDTGSAAQGGEYGWAPASNYVDAFREAVETAEVGAFAGPVQTEFGYHVIQVLGRRDVEMTEPQINQERTEEFAIYLDNLRMSEGVAVETFPIWADNVPREPVFAAR